MSDIVERLRLLVPSDSSGAAFDAVTEIVRLRNELHIAQEWSARVIAGQEEDVRQITALRAEVERLKIENIQMQAALGYGILAEDERHILPSNPFKCGTCDASKHLRAENAALHEALCTIEQMTEPQTSTAVSPVNSLSIHSIARHGLSRSTGGKVMTDEQLRKALAKALCRAAYPADRFPNLNVDEQATDPHWSEQADAAIALMRPVIRAEALEEAAKVADRAVIPMCETSADRIAAAIRALKEKPNG